MKVQKNRQQFLHASALKKHVVDNLTLDWSDFTILFCAIVIASVGLGEENSPIIVGSMLISPLMDPLLGLGYGLAIKNRTLFQKGLLILFLQIVLSIGTATIYFLIIDNSAANKALLARTNLSLGIAIVALFGGLAAIIGSAKKDSGNILPGVAIAASLMPPLVTIGFGIARKSWPIFQGAWILFLMNISLIILGAAVGTFALIHSRGISHS
ncbi:DUF389 domain-containing protein [Lactobacillus sp. DCY120]|uniref:DUF389 domain-containing protein n=1 Tax=Bombilactobacillus apium TaxID=2675299 RepID=A0A850R2U5_9LACO|nr:DUF389 domain-containing protein [Bombilactobacillus apium]NVY96331.1 DUF389 domain-containing protein [Bombilactobacillus apium]